MSLCPLYSKCHSILDFPMSSCQSKVTLGLSRATKVMVQVADRVSGITPYDDVTDRLIASCTARMINAVSHDVIDRIVQVCDRVLVSRHTMTSPTDLLHHALQGRSMSCPMTSLTEFCRCSTHFLKTRPIHFLKYRACRCTDNETMQYHFILE